MIRTTGPAGLYARRVKRPLDVIGSCLLLAATAPVHGICALAVLIDSGRPVYFHQLRSGHQGREFSVLKLRTMVVGADARLDGFFTSDMVTSVGAFLRRWSLDELPQLMNILRGDMSFVGPRPTLPSQVRRYTPHQRRRLEVRPGLTGLAQVRHRNDAPWSVRIEADIEYIDRLSLLLDVRLVLATVPTVLSGSGQRADQAEAEVDDLAPLEADSVVPADPDAGSSAQGRHGGSRSTPAPRDIGGDFEPPAGDLLREPHSPPWEERHPTAPLGYVQSGRQALGAIAQALEAEGRRRLLLPAHFCDSMVEPFLRRGWHVTPLPVGDDLFPLEGTIRRSLADPGDTAVLHAPYFGQDTPERVRDELGVARGLGARLIVDETHRPLAPTEFPADFRMATLRKTLPLYDGAYVIGLADATLPRSERTRSALSELRAAAMDAKASYLRNGGDLAVHLELARRADRIVAAQYAPQPMSGGSRVLLQRLDYAEIGRRRRRNARALTAGLHALGTALLFDPTPPGVIPSHVVVIVDRPRELQRALAAEGVFCPIHWPRPTTMKVPVWADRLLSLPVDQRYGPADMDRIVAVLRGCLSRASAGTGATA